MTRGTSRRGIMQGAASAALLAVIGEADAQVPASAEAQACDLAWLDGQSATLDLPLTWGAPWPRGALRPNTQFKMTDADGRAVPVQTWPLAYWPDGTLKWTGHAASGPLRAERLRLEVGRPAQPRNAVRVRETARAVTLTSGRFTAVLPKSGSMLVESAGGVAQQGRIENLRLVCLKRDRPGEGEGAFVTERHVSRVETVVVEQSGPVRAVIRVEGKHVGANGRAWLPFVVRLSLSAGGAALRIVHSFIFDGDSAHDFIAGLGFEFETPLQDELHNRHVRFAGQGEGLWAEAVRNLPGWAGGFALRDRFDDQLAGRAVPSLAQMDERTRTQLATVPAWDSFKLAQNSADHFDITKRTVPEASWLHADQGDRASGLGYIGGVSGGVVFGVRDFWQRHPTALEISGAASAKATSTIWLWSPDAPPMDLRHYSDRAHGLEIQYEDVEPGFSTPNGVARTSEVMLWCVTSTPSRQDFTAYAKAVQAPPLLVCAPQRYHDLNLFGVWSLPDRSTPVKRRLEDEHDRLLAFYANEVDRRQWYGFWSFGDFMHTYDADRHQWRYDVGGFAWANSELVPDLWLWYAFLRSGRADIFRMAEAMTRHTGEVDVHHTGRFAGLGSRHNVSHWGDGAKEARINGATLRRIFYYLTADERTGDLMRAVVNVDARTVEINPLRKILPPTQYPTHARSGPDWFAFAGNWMTEWERTGDTRWRDKILVGLNSIAAMPLGMLSGPAFGYDPATGVLHHIGGDLSGSYHLVTIFGGAETVFELLDLIDAPAFAATWLRFCEFYNADEATRQAALGPSARNAYFGYPIWHARLTAYAAMRKRDPALGARAWNEFLYGFHRTAERRMPLAPTRIDAPNVLAPVDDLPWMETNHAAQWSLNLIELLAMAGEQAPASLEGDWRQSG